MKLVIYILLLAQLGGCAFFAAPAKLPLGTVTEPPVLKTRHNDGPSRDEIQRYASDLNLYLDYLFAYTKSLNRYALSIGWEPPDNPPLCRRIATPVLEAFPLFERRRTGNGAEFEWELADFIRELKRRHERDALTLTQYGETMRSFCLY